MKLPFTVSTSSSLVKPLEPLLEAMMAKDLELFIDISPLPPSAAMWRWVEKYPEDFPLREMSPITADQIHA